MTKTQTTGTWGLLAIVTLALGGCATGPGEDGGIVSRFRDTTQSLFAADREAQAESSAIIADLKARRSALPPGGSFDRVARAVLEADSRTQATELRGARLRAQAAAKNWLPRVGPEITLTSLDDVVSRLLVEQVLFDHGRKKAERAFAAADVEVAAVKLAEATNDRLAEALSLYLDAAEARERVGLERRALRDMQEFERIMRERVRGGISDRSDLDVVRQKLAEIRAELSAQREVATTGLAELNAMSVHPLDEVEGLSDVRVAAGDAVPLEVLAAEAMRARDIARARIDRADQLPGVTAGGSLGDDGSGMGLQLGGDGLLGLGTGARLKAIEAQKEAASRRVRQAKEDADRDLRRMDQRLVALSRQVAETSELARRAKSTLELFQAQYENGQRQVMDVVGVYETFAQRQRDHVARKHELAQTRLEVARHLGLLADGSEI
ncbi:TolC family protein [Roseovarius salinarum]|uniref:TolC family protein n=1 Tax=Roseovarius salinarum TaxID=1981892 RepID=UPI000C32D1E1|nr:TolC family protein [Roseovarius salinarum]